MPASNKLIDYIQEVGKQAKAVGENRAEREIYLKSITSTIPALISEYNIDLSWQDPQGKTALMYACDLGLETIVKLLFEWNGFFSSNHPYVDALDAEDNNALIKAVNISDDEEKPKNIESFAHREIIKIFSNHSYDYNTAEEQTQNKLIQTAIEAGNLWYLTNNVRVQDLWKEANLDKIIYAVFKSSDQFVQSSWIRFAVQNFPSTFQDKDKLLNHLLATLSFDPSGKKAQVVLDNLNKELKLAFISFSELVIDRTTDIFTKKNLKNDLKPNFKILWSYQNFVKHFASVFKNQLSKAIEIADVDCVQCMYSFYYDNFIYLSTILSGFMNESLTKIIDKMWAIDNETFIKFHEFFINNSFYEIYAFDLYLAISRKESIDFSNIDKYKINDLSLISAIYLKEALILGIEREEFNLVVKILHISPGFFAAKGFPLVFEGKLKSEIFGNRSAAFVSALMEIRDADDVDALCKYLKRISKDDQKLLATFYNNDFIKMNFLQLAVGRLEQIADQLKLWVSQKEIESKNYFISPSPVKDPLEYFLHEDPIVFIKKMGKSVLNCRTSEEPYFEKFIKKSIDKYHNENENVLNKSDHNGRTFLSYACELGNYVAVKIVIQMLVYGDAVKSMKYAVAFEDLCNGKFSDPTSYIKLKRQRNILKLVFNKALSDRSIFYLDFFEDMKNEKENSAEIAFENNNFRFLNNHLSSTMFCQTNKIQILKALAKLDWICYLSWLRYQVLSRAPYEVHRQLKEEFKKQEFKNDKNFLTRIITLSQSGEESSQDFINSIGRIIFDKNNFASMSDQIPLIIYLLEEFSKVLSIQQILHWSVEGKIDSNLLEIIITHFKNQHHSSSEFKASNDFQSAFLYSVHLRMDEKVVSSLLNLNEECFARQYAAGIAAKYIEGFEAVYKARCGRIFQPEIRQIALAQFSLLSRPNKYISISDIEKEEKKISHNRGKSM